MRSGYSESCEGWELIRWRGAVASAIRGKRGQAFLHELIAALDVLPQKRLIAEDLEKEGEVCALGSVGRMRGMDLGRLEPEDYVGIADAFALSPALVRELEFVNDDSGWRSTPEERFQVVREWAVEHLRTGAAQGEK